MLKFTKSKINLGLYILSKRDDGYHDISTVMCPIEWGDILEIVPAKGNSTTLTVTGRKVDCAMEDNLIYKAYAALSASLPSPLPAVDIYLRKIVPDGAGLGGGSSDASTTLLMLKEMFDLNVSHETLEKIAGGIGADCPLFINNCPMWATGTGTTLHPIALPQLSKYKILVVKPPESVSTREAYAGVCPQQPDIPLPQLLQAPIEQWQGSVINDFEESVLSRHPVIAEVKKSLLDLGAVYAAMSGSGSSVFGIFQNIPDVLPALWKSDGWSYWSGAFDASKD